MQNLRDLIQDINGSYMVPSPIMISGNGRPTDIRQTCETVQDFEEFYNTMGMDIRYPGLVTYEKQNNRFLGYKKSENGGFEWVELEGMGEVVPPQIESRLSELEEKISSMYLEYEEQLLLFK